MVSSRHAKPASTLMVRSRGSYSTIRRSDSVLSCVSAGSMGPAIKCFDPLPASAIERPCEAASRSASASSAGLEGASTLQGPRKTLQNQGQNGQNQRPDQRRQKAIHRKTRRKHGGKLQQNRVHH